MAMTIIIKDDHGNQVETCVELDDDKSWEEKCYQVGCGVARSVAKALDERYRGAIISDKRQEHAL